MCFWLSPVLGLGIGTIFLFLSSSESGWQRPFDLWLGVVWIVLGTTEIDWLRR